MVRCRAHARPPLLLLWLLWLLLPCRSPHQAAARRRLQMAAPAFALLRGRPVGWDVLRVLRLPSFAGCGAVLLHLAPLAHGQHALLQLLTCPLRHTSARVPGMVSWPSVVHERAAEALYINSTSSTALTTAGSGANLGDLELRREPGLLVRKVGHGQQLGGGGAAGRVHLLGRLAGYSGLLACNVLPLVCLHH